MDLSNHDTLFAQGTPVFTLQSYADMLGWTRQQRMAIRKAMAGAQFLDRTFGNETWDRRVHAKIKAGVLDISSCDECAMATAAEQDYITAEQEHGLSLHCGQNYGFISSRSVGYAALLWAWQTVMHWRNKGVTPMFLDA